jgi:tetratricopeptide (TPR) repeat protein
MHGYATAPDGSRQELILIKDWDFNWQGDYRYAKPVFLAKGTTLAMRFTYDNSAENVRNPNHPPKRVKYGLQTTDEMGELWFQVLPRRPAVRNLLAGDFSRHLAQSTVDYNEHVLKENPNDAEAHTRAGRARLYFGQVPEALAHFQAAVQANPKYDRAWYELGFIHLRQNQLTEAQQEFENVLGLNPDDYEAEGSLGAVFLQKRDLEKAEAHFRAALRINPQDAVARGNLDLVLKSRGK